MAKKLTKKEQEMVAEIETVALDTAIETVEVEEIETVELGEVSIEAPVEAKRQKLVRIRVKEKLKCFIGEWYYFEKNKVYSVPEHVKEHLLSRGKLLPM